MIGKGTGEDPWMYVEENGSGDKTVWRHVNGEDPHALTAREVVGLMETLIGSGFDPDVELPQCSWGVGGDVTNGCDEIATDRDLCSKHSELSDYLESVAESA